ncbi:carbohydrate ABC transporter permease [Actinoallomurus purpureus]|uniref:carbohydrate ABC transporter permease n=1 Tax=Actinoallomurus purpureus TaxID=478114 RepID=UPI002093D9AA|nr:carbohydrate ABC transporter permease [Actinoallomurus purpureus]MCO6007993.1 carbohydrate ABC transporter permease [Actinoallomurus purpureus]
MLLLSLHPTNDIYAHPLGLDGRWQLSNYTAAWRGVVGGAPLSTYIVNSLLVALCSLAIGVTCGSLAGYGLARATRGLSNVVSRIMVLALSVPLVVALIPTFELLGRYRLLNSVLGVSLVYAAFMTPTIALIMRSVFAAVPRELLEAAKIDGYGEFAALLRVVLPISKGGFISVSLLGLIFVWSEVQFAVVLLTRPQNRTLSVGLLSFQGQFVSDQGAFFAGLVIATFPIVLLFLFFQRYVTSGITLGAIK